MPNICGACGSYANNHKEDCKHFTTIEESTLIEVLVEKLRVATEALEFYGKPHNWSSIGDFADGEIVAMRAPLTVLDAGEKAREALSKIGEK